MKLPLGEAEQDAFRGELELWSGAVSSVLLAVEAVRACRRVGPGYVELAQDRLERMTLLRIDEAVQRRAARLDPPALRSLDAIHLATALSIREDIGVFIAYDARLQEAAAHGLRVIAPA